MPSNEIPVAYVLGTFPQPSQTFIAREIRGLRRLGLKLTVFALARRSADVLEPPDREWYPEVRFVPRAFAPSVIAANLAWLFRDPRRYLQTLAAVAELPHKPRILALRSGVLVMRAAWIARELARGGGCRQIHAHFALAQTEVAMATARLLDGPYSFTAHARDIYATPSALAEKMRGAARVITCTAYNAEHLRGLGSGREDDHVRLVHHAVELDERPPHPHDVNATPLLLAAGRLIEKKGFDVLIAACARLRDRGVAFQCRIAGSGRLRGALVRKIALHRLTQHVELTGWISSGRVAELMATADIFVMPSKVADNGDRDGIPNVVLEAMAASLPVVATRVSGIPEAVEDGTTGMLVAPGDEVALADAIEKLLGDRAARAALGAAARRRAAEEFAFDVSSRRLVDALALDLA